MMVIEVDKGQGDVTLIKLNEVLIYCNISTSFFKNLYLQFLKHDQIFHLEIRLKRKFFFFYV